jgi:GT2 family glycosyltransferase
MHLERACDLAIHAGRLGPVKLVYGDSSPEPALTVEFVDELRARCAAISAIDYRFFDANLGSARGHNRLLGDVAEDLVLIMNPDVMIAPDALLELCRALEHDRTGLVEARQLPVEHPKDYDPHTGETGWATTACALFLTDRLRR